MTTQKEKREIVALSYSPDEVANLLDVSRTFVIRILREKNKKLVLIPGNEYTCIQVARKHLYRIYPSGVAKIIKHLPMEMRKCYQEAIKAFAKEEAYRRGLSETRDNLMKTLLT